MNNKGQSLVFFVLILPLIALFFMLVVNTLSVEFNNNHNKNVIKDDLKMILKKDIRDVDEIKEILSSDLTYQQIDLFIIDDRINISISIKNNDLIKKKVITYNYCGNYINQEITNNRCI